MKVVAIFLLLLLCIGIASATTVYIYPTNDRSLYRVGSGMTWTSARNGVGTSSAQTYGYAYMLSDGTGWEEINRYGIGVDLSSLSGKTITNVTLSLYGNYSGSSFGNTSNIVVTSAAPTNYASWATADYQKYGDVVLGNLSFASVNTSGYNNITLNANGVSYFAGKAGGNASVMIRSSWDVDNVTYWQASKSFTETFLGLVEPGTSKDPVFTITYTDAAASFTTNASTTNLPRANIGFTDTSSLSGVTIRTWKYKDYSGYSTDGYTQTANPVWNEFSNSNNPTPVYGWGAGNWSIELDEYNGAWLNTTHPYKWVNVSGGGMLTTNLTPEYHFFNSSIWKINKTNMTVDSHNATWMVALNSQTSNDHLGYYLPSSIFIVNSSTAIQLMTHSSNSWYFDYNPVPIPDNMVTESASSDRHATLFDLANNTMYELYSTDKNANGTWNGVSAIWNLSDNRYRMGGETYAGGNYYSTYPTVVRNNTSPTWSASMSGDPSVQGYLRKEEVESGFINHSLFLTVPYANGTAIYPAIGAGVWHEQTGVGYNSTAPPAGAFVRLNANYNISAHSLGTKSKVIAQALKTYGGWVGDSGAGHAFNIIGVRNQTTPCTSNCWSDADLTDLDTLSGITTADLEFIDVRPLIDPSTTCSSGGGYDDSQISGYHMCFSMWVNTTESGAVTPTFTKSKTVVRIPSNITFTDTTSVNPGSWDWSFGDGSTSLLQNPTYKYKRPGRFIVSLTTSGGVATSTVVAVGGSSDQLFTPFRTNLFVSAEKGTYTTSRLLSDQEREMTEEKLVTLWQ